MIPTHATQSHESDVLPYPQEALLVDAVAEMAGERILCTSPGLAQFAAAAAVALPHTVVTCTYLDLYRARLAGDRWPTPPPNLKIECAADLPNEPADVVALPLSATGEADLVRELIQQAHQRLTLCGKLYATTPNASDTWLGEQLAKTLRQVERRVAETGALYVGTKFEPLKKVKDYSCEFAFRDRGRLIRAFSRPGVFSHRHIDPGARHLIDAMQIESDMRVLDLGCGAGTVALAAACREPTARVHAVDSNSRAVECTARGAELNELANVATELNADGNIAGTGHYDLVLANPPYYSGFRIARHFVTAARAALRPGGKLVVVTKHPSWYAENLPRWFDDVSHTERKNYHLFQSARPAD